MKVLGLMSGTSVDGIDAAIVDMEGGPEDLSVELHAFTCVPFTTTQQEQIFQLFGPATGTVDRICQMNFALGEWFAQAAQQAISDAGLRPTEVDLIGSHGQTVYHSVDAASPVKSTLQIGEAAVIAERTGITTVADFRVADVAAGGQGAPLVSYPDWLLLRHPTRSRAIQNIGGIANVTYLPRNAQPQAVISFDTGPGNMLIDDAARRMTNNAQTYDRDGLLAAQGQVDEDLLAELVEHPYLAQSLPKTTGREQFGASFAADVWAQATSRNISSRNIIATLTAYTAVSIAEAYRRYLPQRPDEVILCGGGANNPTLVALLQTYLSPARVVTYETLGYSSDAKEAMAFAMLAYEALHGRPGNLPACTDAARPVMLGKIAPGRNYRALLTSVTQLD